MRTQGNRRATLAVVLSALALAAAVGGPAIADQVKSLIGGKQIKKNAITSKHVKNGTLTTQDFKAGTLTSGPRGPEGPAGLRGPEGKQGPPGQAAPAGATEFVIAPEERDWEEPLLEIGAFKVIAGCQPNGEFTAGRAWEGAGGPATVETFEGVRLLRTAGPEPEQFVTHRTINNGSGGNTGVIDGTYKWDLVATSGTGTIDATIWLWGNDTDSCRITARGYLEGDAALVK